MILRNAGYAEIAQRIRRQNSRVLVYGAGMIGQVVVPYIIEKYNLYSYISCYVDADRRKWEHKISCGSYEYRIVSPEVLQHAEEHTVLFITNSKFSGIVSDLDRIPALETAQGYIIPIIQIYEARLKKKDLIRRYTETPVIPRKLHYCWFGKKEMPEFLQKCIATWREHCPDYEVICWNEENYDISRIPYVKQAYERKKYSFASDLARLDILYEEGGIYLDTDVTLLKNLDDLRYQEAFTGREKWGNINTGGGCGAIPHHPMIKRLLEYRKEFPFLLQDGSLNMETNGLYETFPFLERGMRVDHTLQKVGGMTVYPPDVFHPYDYMSGETHVTGNTYGIHHFYGGWMEESDHVSRTRTQEEYRKILERMNLEENRQLQGGRKGSYRMGNKLMLSTLPKTWIFDLDGTLVKHNGYKLDGEDTLLPGAKEYLSAIPQEDRIILCTSRTEAYRDMTLRFLEKNGIRYDQILFQMPMGERIVVNDRKPSGIDMAVAINVDRDDLKLPEIVREK